MPQHVLNLRLANGLAADPGGGGGSSAPQLDQSIWVDDGDNSELNRTMATGDSDTRWTWSAWIKRSAIGTAQSIFSYSSGSFHDELEFNTDNTLEFVLVDTSIVAQLITDREFRDTHAWYHIVIVWDTDNATSGDRLRMYINGVRETSFSTETYPSSGQESMWNTAVACDMLGINGGDEYDGYVADVTFLDDYASTDATEFGEFDSNGLWRWKDQSGLTYGTNGFRLQFEDSGDLGNDSSGNGNDWTPTNISSTNSIGDSPTVNYPTWTELYNFGTPTLSEGNRRCTYNSATEGVYSSLAVPAFDKWYCEIDITTLVDANFYLGLQGLPAHISSYWYSSSGNGAYGISNRSALVTDGVQSGGSGSADFSSGDIGLIARSGAKLWLGYYESSTVTWVGGGDPATDTTPTFTLPEPHASNPMLIAVSGGTGTTQDVTIVPESTNWTTTVPSGFSEISAKNIYDAMITEGGIAKPNDYFDVLTYTGNGTAIGSGGNAITGLAFQPNLVWIKNRDQADQHQLADSVRGANEHLVPDTNAGEVTQTEGIASFDSGGFTVGSLNQLNTNTESFVAWCFKETAGFFDIVTYTGDGSAGNTIAHSLGVAPQFVICKNRDGAYSWAAYHEGVATDPETDYMVVDSNGGKVDNATFWNDTAPDSSNITVGTSTNTNGSTVDYVSYLFSSTLGLCSIGFYIGNGSTDGPVIHCGFKPRMLFNKSSSTGSWEMWDTARGVDNKNIEKLTMDGSTAEGAGSDGLDILSNGFKWKASGAGRNNSGVRYTFCAFADDPRQLLAA